jgi:hypothetical protein
VQLLVLARLSAHGTSSLSTSTQGSISIDRRRNSGTTLVLSQQRTRHPLISTDPLEEVIVGTALDALMPRADPSPSAPSTTKQPHFVGSFSGG